MLLHSFTVERFGDSERLALRRGVAALVGDLQSAGTAPPMVTLTVEPASVRATAVVFAPNRTVATSYVDVLAAQTPQSLSAAIAVHYTGTSLLTVDALEGPFTRAVTRQTPQPPAQPLPAPSPPSCFVFENCPFGLPPPLPDIFFFGLLTLAILGSMLLWYSIRRRRRNIEQQRKAQMAQRTTQEKTAAVSLQARARSWLAKRTRQRTTEAREAAATRLQAHVRSTLQIRKMKAARLERAAELKAARLERAARAATTLQRVVRLRRGVRGRAVEAKLAQMRSLAESVVQMYARRWLEAHRLRRSRSDSVYRRVRAHWLRMSRRGRRLQHLVIRWRAMADAVLEAPPGAPAEAPVREAVVSLWQILWRSLVVLRIVPATPTRRLKHTLLCRLRLAALAGPPRPHTRPSPLGALPLLRELTGRLLACRSPSPIEAAPKLHSFSSSPGWSPAATTFRSPDVPSPDVQSPVVVSVVRRCALTDVPSPPPRMLAGHGGRSESSVDLPRVSARRGLPRADVSSTMPQAQRLPAPERRVPAASDRATTTTTMSATADRPAPFASGDAFTPPRHAGVSSASQPSAIRRTPTLSELGSDASHTGAATQEGPVPRVDVPRSCRTRSEVVPNRVSNVKSLDVAASDAADAVSGVLAPSSGASARAVSARQSLPALASTRERVAAHTEAQTNERSGPPAMLSRGRSHAASVHV